MFSLTDSAMKNVETQKLSEVKMRARAAMWVLLKESKLKSSIYYHVTILTSRTDVVN